VTGIVAVADLLGAIGFSSFVILTYYAIANAAAFKPPRPATPVATSQGHTTQRGCPRSRGT